MRKIATFTATGIAAIALGAGLVGAATAASAAPLHQSDKGLHSRSDRLTGEQAQKAIEAALAAVPGTADHAHTTVDGYRVKVITADGTRIIVTLDTSFVVTGQQNAGPGRKGGDVTDEEKTKATEAALAAVPGATVLDVHKARASGFAVMVRTGDGVKKVVKLDSSYALISVQDAKKGKARGHGKHRHGTSVSATTAFTARH